MPWSKLNILVTCIYNKHRKIFRKLYLTASFFIYILLTVSCYCYMFTKFLAANTNFYIFIPF